MISAVDGSGRDAGVPWHYGDPFGEQRAADRGCAVVDRSHRGMLVVSGPDRLSWLHTVTTQHLANLRDGDSTQALVLSPRGHVEQHWWITELGEQVWLDVEPSTSADVLAYLTMMRFMLRVEPVDVSTQWALLAVIGARATETLAGAGLPSIDDDLHAVALRETGFLRRRDVTNFDLVVPRAQLDATIARLTEAGARRAGTWAYEARRVARREPRFGYDTDHRTIPHEVGWIGRAVHLDKGCYRGQETVARVHNLGKPPRRLVLLHLAGESDELPAPGTPVELAGRPIGFLGTAVHHSELGPIALAVVKRTVAEAAANGDAPDLLIGSTRASIDPAPPEQLDLPAHAGRTFARH